MGNDLLKQIQGEINAQVEEARRRRNEEDRKYIVSQIGKDLAVIVAPLLKEIANSAKFNREELKSILKEIKLTAIPDIKVNVPSVNVPQVKIPPIRVPTPQITVKPAEVKMPKEMEVKGMGKLLKALEDVLGRKIGLEMGGINRDKPLNVILTDEKGREYKAMGGGILSSGGGGVVEIKKISGATGLGGGTKTVAAAGVPEQLTSTSMPVRRVWIQALDTNTGAIVVGGTDVDETSASRKGIALFATQGQWFNVSNLNMIWVDVAVNGEGINYLYEV